MPRQWLVVPLGVLIGVGMVVTLQRQPASGHLQVSEASPSTAGGPDHDASNSASPTSGDTVKDALNRIATSADITNDDDVTAAVSQVARQACFRQHQDRHRLNGSITSGLGSEFLTLINITNVLLEPTTRIAPHLV